MMAGCIMRSPQINTDAQEYLFPTQEELDILSIALTIRDANREKWGRFCERHPEPQEILGSLDGRFRRMLAIVYYGLKRNKIELSKKLEFYFRFAQTRELSRGVEYWKQTSHAVAFLKRKNIDAVLIRGAGPALNAYPGEIDRHSHDVDLLLKGEDVDRARQELTDRHFTSRVFDIHGKKRLGLMHPSELEFVLNDGVDHYSGEKETFQAVWTHVRQVSPGRGIEPLPVISLELSLVHALQAFYEPPSEKSLYSFIDLSFMLGKASGIDREWVKKEIQRRHLGLACGLTMRFLEKLGRPLSGRTGQIFQDVFDQAHVSEFDHMSKLLVYDKHDMLRLVISGKGFNRIPFKYAARRIRHKIQRHAA